MQVKRKKLGRVLQIAILSFLGRTQCTMQGHSGKHQVGHKAEKVELWAGAFIVFYGEELVRQGKETWDWLV